jgi:hypothetical protein
LDARYKSESGGEWIPNSGEALGHRPHLIVLIAINEVQGSLLIDNTAQLNGRGILKRTFFDSFLGFDLLDLWYFLQPL